MITINKLQKNFGEKKAVDIENYIISSTKVKCLVWWEITELEKQLYSG